MSVLEVAVGWRRGDGWPATVVSRVGSELPIQRGTVLTLDRGELADRLGVADDDVAERDAVELLGMLSADLCGEVLGRALFRDDVRDLFVSARSGGEEELRVLVSIEDPDLRSVRWERLCAPFGERWRPLRLEQRVPFSMYLPSGSDARYPPIGRTDLQALAVVAGPREPNRFGLEPFDLTKAATDLREALGDVPCDVLAAVEDAVGPATLDVLCERITGGSYTMLHFVCHGAFTKSETFLYLENADGRIEPVSASRLIARLESLSGQRGLPRFGFLAMCESARPEAERALGGLAQRLVRELGMPAVVAMTDRVSMATAWDLTSGFYQRLREHGQVDLALTQACAPLAERGDVTVPALYSRLGERPLFSATLDLERPLTGKEMEVGLARLEDLVAVRAPVLQEAFAAAAASLRRTTGSDPAPLAPEARKERSDALAALERLTVDVTDLEGFNALALGATPGVYDNTCPFMGLAPFTENESAFFFGRGALVERLRRKLGDHNFLPVLGSSGSGKSSLVRAGLMSKLGEEEPDVSIEVIAPGDDPLTQLELAVSKVGSAGVLVIDQFEQLFVHAKSQDRRPFIDEVLTLVDDHRVIITMRADFWGDCAPYEELRALMQARQELVPPMDARELRAAMVEQAAAAGLRFEGNLADIVFEDVEGEPGAMPLLQHALRELWKRRHGRWLKQEEYRRIGGIQNAIANTADDVYVQLSTPDRARMEQVFMTLTSVSDDVEPGKWLASRRRVRLADLLPASGAEPTRALLERLAEPRLVMLTQEANGQTEIEVTHEALIRQWPRLQEWIQANLVAIRTRDDLRRAARAWEEHERDSGYLAHRGSRLEEAQPIAEHTASELELLYLEACRRREADEERSQREGLRAQLRYLATGSLTRVFAGWLGIALPLLLIFGDALLFDGKPFPRSSLSSYYYSGMREFFVVSLVAIGFFLVTYMSVERTLDNQLTMFAGIAVIVVALFPIGRAGAGMPLTPLQNRFGETTVEWIHFVAAAAFTVSLATISYFFAIREGMRVPRELGRSPSFWRRYHLACAGVIVAALILAVVSGLTDRPENGLLIAELAAVWAFGASWLMKGLEFEILFGRRLDG